MISATLYDCKTTSFAPMPDNHDYRDKLTLQLIKLDEAEHDLHKAQKELEDEYDRVLEFISVLDEEGQTLIKMRYLYSKSLSAISGYTGISKTQVYRKLKKYVDILETKGCVGTTKDLK